MTRRESGTGELKAASFERLCPAMTNHLVIPEAAQRLSGIHTPDGGYGFRARAFGVPRNDERGALPLHRHARA
jgi:hypothetical protein